MDDLMRAAIMAGRPPSRPGYTSPRGGVADPALAAYLGSDLLNTEFGQKYIQDWSKREQAWGMQALLEVMQQAAGVTLPGTTAAPASPFDIPTETVAPVSNTAAPAPNAETRRGDFQGLAAELGVRPRKAERLARTERRRRRHEAVNASGGTVTTGDIDPGATVSIDVSGGTARRRARGY